MKLLNKLYAKMISATWKNFKLGYYILSFIRMYIPRGFYQRNLNKILALKGKYSQSYLELRLNYYLKLGDKYTVNSDFIKLGCFDYIKSLKNYYFDTYQYTRYFDDKNMIAYAFGDVIHIPPIPSIVKSRPIEGDNANSVLLNLDKIRHFTFVKDIKRFEDKEFKILWRGNVFPHQKNRILLVEQFHNHPLCNVGHVNEMDDFNYKQGDKLTLYEHLKYKFILSLEGNDVATNLKWIMSSNSIAVMPKPKYETWFMEGTLIPDYHYILVKDDFSDLIDKITYYHQNPTAAEVIIHNANQYVKQFQNKKREKLISLLVLQQYFNLQH